MVLQLGSGALLALLLLMLLASTFRILREYERGVVFQLGRFWQVKGPGLIILISAGAADGPGGPAHRGPRCPAPGRDHPRQRLGEG